MGLSRRSFLTETAALGILPALLADSELAHAISTAEAQPGQQPTAGEIYWKSLYAGGAARGNSKPPKEERDPRIVHYSDKAGLRWVEDIKPAELPSFDEDVVVTMELSGFRPGKGDTSRLAKVKFAQLHLSCQRVSGSEFLGPIVWAALATIFADKASKLPSEQSLNWGALTGNQSVAQSRAQSSGPRLSHMVLNQGAGHLSVNISSTPTNSPLHKVLGAIITGARIMSPLLGFPGITVPALQSFYDFYGKVEQANPENFLLNSAQRDVAVTQQGADNSLISANAIRLVNGDYVFVPKSQEADFQKNMDQLIVQNGYVVQRNAKGTPDDRIDQAIETVTYVTLNVKVQPASSFPASSTVTDPLLDSVPRGSSPASTKNPPKKKP
jgi:hypothetical protein